MAERHPEQDVLVDLALGEVDGPEQDALARHLAACDVCRADYSDVAAGLEHVLTAAPRTSPPPGFDARALAAIGLTPTADAHPKSARQSRDVPRWSLRRRTFVLAAAAAGLGVALGVGAATVLGPPGDEPPSVAVSSGTPLRTSDGDVVGQVSAAVQGGERVLVVDITGAPEGASYDCRVLVDGGDPVHVGRWTLRSGGPTVWVVPAPDGASGVELVADSGAVWSAASL
ncbi:cupin domain-containing protein [Georgenia subflava]|uniref:Zinc-finger domain-containing protein n=1 Tax=Georgenia subflava TaxID=1622177 RepID=A0A6N7ELY6_9MICO|nr:hypothetical protein [Georgenia subflava]MPV38083.1 hypothetical protein [Georgenia subflava]